MKTLGNILWHFPFFGFIFALLYAIWGICCCITIIFIPIGLGYLQLSRFLLSPFSMQMVPRRDLVYLGHKEQHVATKSYNTLLKILYFPFGLISAITIIGVIAAEFVSLIGIPCALVWAKSLETVFCPIQKVCVTQIEADLIDLRKAEAIYSNR